MPRRRSSCVVTRAGSTGLVKLRLSAMLLSFVVGRIAPDEEDEARSRCEQAAKAARAITISTIHQLHPRNRSRATIRPPCLTTDVRRNRFRPLCPLASLGLGGCQPTVRRHPPPRAFLGCTL